MNEVVTESKNRMLPPVDTRVMRDLDFARIQAAVADRATTEVGRARCRELPLLPTGDDVRAALQLTGELMTAFRDGGHPSLSGVFDVEAAVHLAERGGTLDP